MEKTTQGAAKSPLKSQMAMMVDTTHRLEFRARRGHTIALYLRNRLREMAVGTDYNMQTCSRTFSTIEDIKSVKIEEVEEGF